MHRVRADGHGQWNLTAKKPLDIQSLLDTALCFFYRLCHSGLCVQREGKVFLFLWLMPKLGLMLCIEPKPGINHKKRKA